MSNPQKGVSVTVTHGGADPEAEREKPNTQQSDPSAGAGDPVSGAPAGSPVSTGRHGNGVRPKGSTRRLPAWPRFLDGAEERNPYVRQYNAL